MKILRCLKMKPKMQKRVTGRQGGREPKKTISQTLYGEHIYIYPLPITTLDNLFNKILPPYPPYPTKRSTGAASEQGGSIHVRSSYPPCHPASAGIRSNWTPLLFLDRLPFSFLTAVVMRRQSTLVTLSCPHMAAIWVAVKTSHAGFT